MTSCGDDKLVGLTIDGREVQGRVGDSVLRAALDNGIEIPYYCWHPGLSVVASCRLCLVELDDVDGKTGKVARLGKLVPSCQTPVKAGLAVWTNTDKVRQARRAVMEFLLLNHPLDCPVCDQAGECYLQDFSYRYGSAESRMIDTKLKQPKKDLGENLLLYADRCILCTRCVRFCREISGEGEIAVIDRGDRCQIDVFAGRGVENKLSGNVADICPVGAFLDKTFLFRERVWYLQPSPSICSGCASGCAIWIDQREERIGRFRPRYNPAVNGYWMCDEGRYLWQQAYRDDRLTDYRFGPDGETRTRIDQVGPFLTARLETFVAEHGQGRLAVVMSPMLDCEVMYMICRLVRTVDPQAAMVAGQVVRTEGDETFAGGFTIAAEKVPNAVGMTRILDAFGGPQMPIADLADTVAEKRIEAVWITAGYFDTMSVPRIDLPVKPELLIVQDTFAGVLSDQADVVLPLVMWTERDGSFINRDGQVQPFARGVIPPTGIVQDGQWLAAALGYTGIYRPEMIRTELAELLGGFDVCRPPKLSEYVH